jgi:hypothetical protein
MLLDHRALSPTYLTTTLNAVCRPAPALVDLMKFDDVAVRIMHEKLLCLRPGNPGQAPEFRATLFKFCLRLRDIGHR